ncbi:serine/threonine protein kinase [Pirellulaceae bacterium SH449]
MTNSSFDDTTKEAITRARSLSSKAAGGFELDGNEPDGKERDDVELCRHAIEKCLLYVESVPRSQTGCEPPQQGPRFENVRFVGAGGFGVVFAAFDRTLEIEVALKLLRPSKNSSVVRRRFLEEAKITAGLNHPNIVRLYDSGVLGEIPYISSTFLSGGSLAELVLESPDSLTGRDAAEIGCQIAEAVSYAHSKATFHRDLKPSNILIQRTGQTEPKFQATLTDFGLAKRWDKEVEDRFTQEGEVPGTVRYMAPEQALGDQDEFTIRSEVFSLGIILYQMATGKLPFDGLKFSDVRNQIVHHRPVRPSVVNKLIPKDFESIILKCLEKEPSHRYDSVGDLAKDLRRFLNSEPVEASRPTQFRQALWYAKKHPVTTVMVVGLFSVLAVSATVVSFALWQQKIATAKEFQTKVDYVMLFGSLIDDVLDSNKDQQTALLDALAEFRKSMVADLAISPNNPQLSHLLSLIYHYESTVYQRKGDAKNLINSRVKSVAILQSLSRKYRDNAKYRFQYIFGAMMLVLCSHSAETPMAQQSELLSPTLGVSSIDELMQLIRPEIDYFMAEFPSNPKQINACLQFKSDLAHFFYHGETDERYRIQEEVISESIRLADMHPDEPMFIKPAINSLRHRVSEYHEAVNFDAAFPELERIDKLFETYLRSHFGTRWVKGYFAEVKLTHAQLMMDTERYDELEELCSQILPICEKLVLVPEYRLVMLCQILQLQTMLLRCEEAFDKQKIADQRLEMLVATLENPETPIHALTTYAAWAKPRSIPVRLSETVAKQIALRKDTP